MALSNIGTLKGDTFVVGDTYTDVITVAAGKVVLVIGMTVANTDVTGLQANIQVEKSGGDTAYLCKDLPIGANDAASPMEETKLVLEAGDKLKVECVDSGKTLDVIVGYIEYGDSYKFKSAVVADVGVEETIYTVPTDKKTTILGMNLANPDANTIAVSAKVTDNSKAQTVHIVKGVAILTGSANTALGREKLVLEEADALKISCDTTTPSQKTTDVIFSYIEEDE